MKKEYTKPHMEIIDFVAKGYILSTNVGFGGNASAPGVDPDENIDEAKGNFFTAYEENPANNEWPSFNVWED